MDDCEVKYSISASTDSAVFVEVLQRKLFREHKYFLSFETFTGELHYVSSNPTRSRLVFELDPESIACTDRRLSPNKQRRLATHAKDFVSRTSTGSGIRFCSQQISAKALRGFAVEGLLTLRDTTQSVRINTTFTKSGPDRLEIEGDSTIRFSAFGIKAPSSLLGMNRFSDQGLVQFHLQALRTTAEH